MVASSARAAAAATSGCADGRVSVEDATLPPRFAESVQAMCERLPTLTNLDPTARIRLAPAGADVVVEATLEDGRSTSRRVSSPEQLGLTVEALLALPPSADTKAPAPVEAPAPPKSPSPPEVVATRPAVPATKPLQINESSVGVELGLELMGRASGKPLYLAASPLAYGGVRVSHWIFGLMARMDAYEALVPNRYPAFEMYGLGAGFFVGRHIVALEAFQLDLCASVLFVSESQGATPAGTEIAGTDFDGRVGVLTRALVGRGPFRGLFTLDGEISPARLRHSVRADPGLPVLPSFGFGLGAGFAWTGP